MATTLGQINTNYPMDGVGPYSAGIEYGSPETNPSKSPLSKFNLSFGLSNNEKKVKADGQPPKRRGPKPDSKPALTRRQELNRQAQRTHRERKEQYIKCLEQEVLHLKESYASCAKERDAWENEARRLTDILIAHGIQVPASSMSPPPLHPTSSGSGSGSYPSNSASTSQTTLPSSANGYSSSPMPPMPNSVTPPGHVPSGPSTANVDYDQTGIDFVLALEKPCMDHMQMLCVASQQSAEDAISGHALMATCPTRNHLIERPDLQYGHKMPEMKASDLLKLLDLSNRLPLDTEITPIMAWATILRHQYVSYMTTEDILTIKVDLVEKIRCYGFGAVLEQFEVDEAINTVLSKKTENYFPSVQ